MRHKRVRKKIHGSAECPRLAVFFSNRNVSAQLIDDTAGRTLVYVSTLQKDVRPLVEGKPMREAAKIIGQKIGEGARQLGLARAVFDKAGYKYGLRLSSLADAARETGLDF
jgi:large subunit ribosomal protein L18